MKRRVKGNIERYYCDTCRKRLFEYIPIENTQMYENSNIPKYQIKRYCASKQKRSNIKRRDFCLDCYAALKTTKEMPLSYIIEKMKKREI